MRVDTRGRVRVITVCKVFGVLCVVLFGWFWIDDFLHWKARVPRDVEHLRVVNRQRVEAVIKAVDQYVQIHQHVPEKLESLMQDNDAGASWLQIPNDAWTRPLHYVVGETETGVIVRVWSYGADGCSGGIGPNEDISVSKVYAVGASKGPSSE